MFLVHAATAAPELPPAMVEYRRAPGYRRLSRTARFGVGLEVAGGGVVGPSGSVRVWNDLWLALAIKPRLSVVGGGRGDVRLNVMTTLAVTYPVATVRRWAFRAKAAGGVSLPLEGHFESVATLAPSVAFWTRKGMELAWTVGPGLYPYRQINYTKADWQGFLYLDFTFRVHPGARKIERGETDPIVPEEPDSDAPGNDWGQVIESE